MTAAIEASLLTFGSNSWYFDKWNRSILLEWQCAIGHLKSCSYIPSLSCLILCLCLAGESIFCLLSASSGWFSLLPSSLSFCFPKKNEVKDDCRPVSVIFVSVGNENNSQNHCRFNIRLKTRQLKHSDDCNIRATWNATHDFNWDQYASWENDANFPTSFKNESWSEENHSWSAKPAITSNGEHYARTRIPENQQYFSMLE